mmetsp:Transcript_57679/g.114512  ORF Transcript_57679/g.114512 Transcript_57679/m.114512 type:complete len:229 (-) Transcript_57679:686-1372(-)
MSRARRTRATARRTHMVAPRTSYHWLAMSCGGEAHPNKPLALSKSTHRVVRHQPDPSGPPPKLAHAIPIIGFRRSLFDCLVNLLEVEGLVLLAIAVEEFVLELNPLEAKGVEERGEVLHDHEHDNRDNGPEGEGEPEHNALGPVTEAHLDANVGEDHILEELGKLRVGEREGPETQVGGGVGDGAQHELDGVNHLVHHHLAKLSLSLVLFLLRRRTLALRCHLTLRVG